MPFLVLNRNADFGFILKKPSCNEEDWFRLLGFIGSDVPLSHAHMQSPSGGVSSPYWHTLLVLSFFTILNLYFFWSCKTKVTGRINVFFFRK